MKKIVSMSIACFSMFATLAAAPSHDLQVVSVHNASQETFDEIMKGNCLSVAIEFPAKTMLPIQLALSGDLMHFVGSTENPGYFEVKQTFYAKCTEAGNPVFSSDLKNWKSFGEFITGNLSVLLSIHDGQPSMAISAETNRRT